MSEWIPVSERRPAPEETVIVYQEGGWIDLDHIEEETGTWYFNEKNTHWIPLPAKPEV